MENVIVYTSFLAFIWAFLVAIFGIPSIIHVANEKKLFDLPGERTVHTSPIPRLGGLAIFAGFLSALVIFGDFQQGDYTLQQLLAGSVVIFFIGLKDDITSVSAFKKFFVQMLATSILMYKGGLLIEKLHGILYITEELDDGMKYLLSFVTIIGITNAINLLDGLDGLSGTIIVYTLLVFGSLFLYMENHYAIVSFCLAGSVVGFLRFNFTKAKIFMGDTGSLVCGFIVAGIAIKYVSLAPTFHLPPILSLAILIIPVIDTLRVFSMRVLKGVSPFAPDKNHLHHRLIDIGFSQVQAVFILLIVNIIFTLVILLLHIYSNFDINLQFLVIVVMSFIFITIVELVYRKKK